MVISEVMRIWIRGGCGDAWLEWVFAVWEVERLDDGVIQALQRGVGLGRAGELASGDEIGRIYYELSISEAD